MVARRGAQVADLSVKDIMDVLEVRASLRWIGYCIIRDSNNRRRN